ncbi:MAG: two-component sensor histidine kinase [Streptosporangiaceae bacterium]|nr:two-component sensor histidine kinase [Streptosporangiaceae bacterium]
MPGPGGQAGWLSAPASPEMPEDAAVGDWGQDAQSLPVLEAINGSPRLARGIVLTVLLVYAAIQTIDLAVSPLPSHGTQLVVDIPAIVGLCALTVWVTSAAAEHWPPRLRLAVLLAEGLLTYIPIIVFGKLWGDMGGFFAGSVLLLLSAWMAWTLFVTVVGSILVLSALWSLNAYNAAYLTLSTLVLGLVVFGLARLSLLIRYVHATRGELAQLAVIRERMRFARDLHDLLGYSLSAITLKAEFTRRLVGSNPGRARDELAEVLDIARQALADVRIVASGYRNISLVKEASSVSSLLTAAGIDAQVEINCGMLDERVDTVLATVLREAVTNMLRHSTPRHCEIEAGITGDHVYLRVANDGAPRSGASGRNGGGLDNLTSRMTAIGGQLTARSRDAGWFDIAAQAPITPSAAHQPVCRTEPR